MQLPSGLLRVRSLHNQLKHCKSTFGQPAVVSQNSQVWKGCPEVIWSTVDFMAYLIYHFIIENTFSVVYFFIIPGIKDRTGKSKEEMVFGGGPKKLLICTWNIQQLSQRSVSELNILSYIPRIWRKLAFLKYDFHIRCTYLEKKKNQNNTFSLIV